MCMLIDSILCRWLGVKSGHFFTWFSSTWSFYAFFPGYPRRRWRKEQQCCWRGQGRGSVRTPCPPSVLCHTSGLLAGVLGCHTPKAAWKVFVGVSVPICFEVVYSVLPGALVNDVYCASLFFVHPFQRDCCSYH